jgi:regulator of nonsense transcripts 1
MSASGTSFLNPVEAAQIEKILYYLIKSGVRPSQIGIITPYKGQRTYIVSYLSKNGQFNSAVYAQVEVASVDGF